MDKAGVALIRSISEELTTREYELQGVTLKDQVRELLQIANLCRHAALDLAP